MLQRSMPLALGDQLGHRAATAVIGDWGMEQVYRATVTTINRLVPLKILPCRWDSARAPHQGLIPRTTVTGH